MSTLFTEKLFIFFTLLLAVVFVGCSHHKTNRGHLLRGDWAIEYNRTPWVGCPPDSGCPEEPEKKCGGLLSCLKKDDDEKKKKGVRRHCGMRRGCTQFNPCCQMLGCGMWVEPGDSVIGDSTISVSASPAVFGGTVNICGLTPFCTPQKPCGLTPNCGKSISSTAQTLVNLQTSNGNGLGSAAMGNMATVRGMSPNGIMANGVAGTVPGTPINRGIVPGSLVSRGIVPGASAITSGGMVAAIGVATPAGTMTPVGVRMPNGVVSNNAVLMACTQTPNCTAAHPCGLMPNCGGAVAVTVVANNAVALASALQAQGASGGVMQAGGMGMLVNPVTNQPINGLTMSGYTQAGYPPIGYAPTGYAPGYPRYAAGMMGAGEIEDEEEEQEREQTVVPETRSVMPVPRFHPVPHQPTLKRSEGMMPTPKSERTVVKPTTTAMTEQRGVSARELEAALDQAYLEGVSAAMDDVERKLEAKRQLAAKAKLEEKILQQAEYVQQQLDEQERLQALAMQQAQRERQLRQQAAQQSEMLAAAEAVPEPKRLPAPKPAVAPSVAKADGNASAYPATLSESLKNSSATGMLAAFFGQNQKGQTPSKSPAQNTAQNPPKTTPKSAAELAAALNLPKKPPVSPMPQEYGLLPEPSESGRILQTQFTADHASIRP